MVRAQERLAAADIPGMTCMTSLCTSKSTCTGLPPLGHATNGRLYAPRMCLYACTPWGLAKNNCGTYIIPVWKPTAPKGASVQQRRTLSCKSPTLQTTCLYHPELYNGCPTCGLSSSGSQAECALDSEAPSMPPLSKSCVASTFAAQRLPLPSVSSS